MPGWVIRQAMHHPRSPPLPAGWPARAAVAHARAGQDRPCTAPAPRTRRRTSYLPGGNSLAPVVGFHSWANFCASAICAGVILAAINSCCAVKVSAGSRQAEPHVRDDIVLRGTPALEEYDPEIVLSIGVAVRGGLAIPTQCRRLGPVRTWLRDAEIDLSRNAALLGRLSIPVHRRYSRDRFQRLVYSLKRPNCSVDGSTVPKIIWCDNTYGS
jgi:hypothetical protein